MIISNLDALLKERKLKISIVAADTGISRTTLTALCNNTGKGIQFDTANALCIYLNVSMSDLFTSIPFDITVTGHDTIDEYTAPDGWTTIFHLKYTGRKGTEFPNLISIIELQSYPAGPSEEPDDYLEITILPLSHNCDVNGDAGNSEEENELLRNSFSAMPPIAIQIFKNRIGKEAIKNSSFTQYYVRLPAELEKPL